MDEAGAAQCLGYAPSADFRSTSYSRMNKRALSLQATPDHASGKKPKHARARVDQQKLLADQMRRASASNFACRSSKYRDFYGSSLRDEVSDPHVNRAKKPEGRK